jgi:hypothetical protein
MRTMLPLLVVTSLLLAQSPFGRYDRDGSGGVSKAEWDVLFAELDRDRDGLLQPVELRVLFGSAARPGDVPAVGAAAPKVSARSAKDGRRVELGKVDRVTVLVFGSWT